MKCKNLEDLRKVVFEYKKVPHYTRLHGDMRISTVLDSEGLHTYMFGGKGGDDLKHNLKTWEELSLEDVSLLLEKLPDLQGEAETK